MINKIMTRNMANLTRGLAPCEMARVCLDSLSVRRLRTLSPTCSDCQSDAFGRRSLRYVVCLLLMMVLGESEVKAQDDYSGVYYIANDNSGGANSGSTETTSYSSASDAIRWYLVPADNPQLKPNNNATYEDYRDAYYSSNHASTAGDPEKPFLTTYQTNKDAATVPSGVTNRAHNSVWIVKKTSDGYYHVIHAVTGKYVIYEVPLPNDPDTNNNASEVKNGKRKTMHLQNPDDETYSLSTNENFKFTITKDNDNIYRLQPKRRSEWYWNPANGNKDKYYGQVAGSKITIYQAGLVGVYDKPDDGGSKWRFESTLLTAPIIGKVSNTITITDANSLPTGYTIRYTIGDGSQAAPTITTGEEYDPSNLPVITNEKNVKAAVFGYGMRLSDISNAWLNQTITLSDESLVYNGLEREPAVTLKYGDNTIPATEYDVNYSDNTVVGTATVTVTNKAGGNFYVITDSKEFEITKAPLTITADAKSKTYGDDDPELTYTSDGLIGSDAITGALTRTAGENIGIYPIRQGTLTAGSNYSIAYSGANLTITAKSIGDGTTPATDIVINIDGDNNVTVTRTTPTSHSLTQNTDFTVSDSEDEGGNRVWTITGINNYTGSAKVMRVGLNFNETEIPSGSNVHDVTPYKATADMTIEGLDAYIVTHVNMSTHKVIIKKINYVKKDEPLLLLTDLTGTSTNFTVTPLYVEEGNAVDTSDNLLKTSLEDGQTVGFGEVYMYYQGKFVMTTGGTLPGGIFYLDNPNPPGTPSGGGTSGAPLLIVIDDTTGMEDVISKMEDVRKQDWYTLDGRRLSGEPTQKGLYVTYGQKIVVK